MKGSEQAAPSEQQQKEAGQARRIEISERGEKIGYADLRYYQKPFPFCCLKMIFVEKKFRGMGFGAKILRAVDAELDATGNAGIFFNTVARKSPARTMYENHGWVAVPGHEDMLSYHLPKSLGQESIEEAVQKVEL